VKNLSLILNGVLAVAVGVLYYLHFSCSSGCATASVKETDTLAVADVTADSVIAYIPDSLPPAGNIAYINLEELTEKYQFYKDGIKALEKEVAVKQNQLAQQQKKWEEDVQRFQQLAPSMNEETRAGKQEQLAADQERLYAYRDELEGSLASKNAEFTKQFLTKLDGYFKGLAKEKNYDYVFVYSKGSPSMIVYANEKLNITDYTLRGLNSQYKKK
jgi:outer membrane protein